MSDESAGSPVIRTMLPSDLDRIIDIDIKVLGKPRPEYWKLKFELLETSAQESSLVAEIDGRIVGFIIGGVSRWEYGIPENIGWIDTIGVDPACQRKGIAKILFAEMTRRLGQAGVDKINTFVKRLDWKLLKFFEGLGFQQGDMINLEMDI